MRGGSHPPRCFHCELRIVADAAQVAIEEDVAAMQMRDKVDPADLPMTRQIRNQKRHANRAAKIAYEVADARDLVIVFLPHAHIGQRADGNEDQRNAYHLEHPHPDDRAEVHVLRNAHHPEHADRCQQESQRDHFSRIELHRQYTGHRHQKRQRNARR